MKNTTEDQIKLIKLEELRKKMNYKLEEEIIEEYDIYSESSIEEFGEDDKISLAEEGFMRGYLAA